MGIAAAMVDHFHDHEGDHMHWNDGATWWMVTMMILFAILVIGVIIWAVTASNQSHRAAGPPPSASPQSAPSNARAILDERFARGEIDVAEYEQRRKLLD